MNKTITNSINDSDHVLIVDDDRGIRELLATYLEKEGMRTSAAANGRQMRAALETATPDLVILDLMLPGEDGLALCRELRSGKHRNVPVLIHPDFWSRRRVAIPSAPIEIPANSQPTNNRSAPLQPGRKACSGAGNIYPGI